MKSGAKYTAAVTCALSVFVLSFSLPMLYGRQADTKMLDKVSSLEPEEDIKNLSYQDNGEKIYSILSTAESALKYGVGLNSIYSIGASDMPQEFKDGFVIQLKQLCSLGIIPDLSEYDLYGDIQYTEYLNLYTPEGSLSCNVVYLKGDGGYEGAFLMDSENYCIYYSAVMLPKETALHNFTFSGSDYYNNVISYYGADSYSEPFTIDYQTFSNLKYKYQYASFIILNGDYYFTCGIENIYMLQYYTDIYNSSSVDVNGYIDKKVSE